MATHVVTCFLRNDAEVLLLKRSEAVGSYPGRWGGVAGHAEGDPDGAVRQEIREETGIDPDRITPVRTGESFEVADGDRRWVVHPFLFDCPTREVQTNWETATYEWVPPTEILRRETVPDLWTSYDRVRPQVETVAADTEHGAAYVSVRALEVLRDEAALVATGQREREWSTLAALARRLREARPAMVVVTNRIDRTMSEADRTPGAVERAASAGVERALRADERAATSATARLGDRVATLSRSETVARALEAAEPDAVLVAESRPGREGVDAAERFATEGFDVTLTTDAALAHAVVDWGADTVVVGADAVLADGRILNKVGTRGVAAVAAREDIETVVVAARDKIHPDPDVEPDHEPREPTEVYGRSAGVSVRNPTFDVTPADSVTVVTDDGALSPEGIRAVACEHRRRREWDG